MYSEKDVFFSVSHDAVFSFLLTVAGSINYCSGQWLVKGM